MPVHINIAESAVFKSTFESELLEFRRRAEEAENRVEQERKRVEQERREKEQARKEKEQERRDKETIQKLGIRNLLRYSSLSIAEIAQSFNVNKNIVLKIKEEL